MLKYIFLWSTHGSSNYLNFEAVKTLWFTAAHGGKGRALMELKDAVRSLSPHFIALFDRFSATPAEGMTVLDFRAFVAQSECGIDDSFIDSNFFECTSYPDDEDDENEVLAIRADVSKFTSAVIRVANASALQDTGESDKGLREQLIEWLTACAGPLGISAEALQSTLGESGMGSFMRDSSFFSPPSSFVGTFPRVFLDLAVEADGGGGGEGGEDVGRVVIELNGQLAPKTAYNFQCLCTGERGMGEVTGVPLCYRGSSFHRVVAHMCIQGGDLANQDGYGGESVYGGEFEDEGFRLLHDREGVVSMGNTGPDTNTSQFFITLDSSPHLDTENMAFGKVVSGMEFVKKISAVGVDDDDKPLQRCFVKDCGIVS
jgi:cyclophilin family peptidyl-prolyl cis-trans isomerase